PSAESARSLLRSEYHSFVPAPPRTSNRLQNFRWLSQRQSDIAYPPAPQTNSSAGRYHAFPPARRRAAMPGPLLLARRRIRLRRESTNLNPPRTPARPDPAVPPDSRGARPSEHRADIRD